VTALMPISSSGEDDEEYGAVLSLGRLRFRLGGGFTFWSFTGDRFVAEVVGFPGSGVKDGVLIVAGRPSIRSTSLLHPCRSRSDTVVFIYVRRGAGEACVSRTSLGVWGTC